MKILLVQGANMSYLGKREPEIYGTTTAAELDAMLQEHAKQGGYELDIFYTHIEGEAIGRIYEAADLGVDAVIINPAGMANGSPTADTQSWRWPAPAGQRAKLCLTMLYVN